MKCVGKWFWCAVLISSFHFAHAQHEVRVTAISVVNELNAEYEYGFNTHFGVNGFGGYVFAWPYRDALDPYKKYGYIGAELRFYPNPKSEIDRFFLGLYGRFIKGNLFTNIYSYDQNQNLLQEVWGYEKMAFGISLGSKWMLGKHFNLGYYAGAGRYLNVTYEEPGTPEAVEFFGLDQNLYDLRLGFFVGYRF
jgi:hypothetical protein